MDAVRIGRWLFATLAALAAASAGAGSGSGAGSGAQQNPYLPIAAARLRSALPAADGGDTVEVARFAMQQHPVTNGEFLAFVRTHPEWQRDRAPAAFVDADYLSHWQTPLALGDGIEARQPVTRVSWFAAAAYCEAQQARLPRWTEWELAAAASEQQRDARADPAWRQRMLDWYAKPASGALSRVGQTPANVYGLQDLHGLVWEWTEDAGSLMLGDDSGQNKADLGKFCGAGALTFKDRDNYAVMMRIALLSSLAARDTTRTLGFRCVRHGSQP